MPSPQKCENVKEFMQYVKSGESQASLTMEGVAGLARWYFKIAEDLIEIKLLGLYQDEPLVLKRLVVGKEMHVPRAAFTYEFLDLLLGDLNDSAPLLVRASRDQFTRYLVQMLIPLRVAKGPLANVLHNLAVRQLIKRENGYPLTENKVEVEVLDSKESFTQVVAQNAISDTLSVYVYYDEGQIWLLKRAGVTITKRCERLPSSEDEKIKALFEGKEFEMPIWKFDETVVDKVNGGIEHARGALKNGIVSIMLAAQKPKA